MAYDFNVSKEVDKVFAKEENHDAKQLSTSDILYMSTTFGGSSAYRETSFAANLKEAHTLLPADDYAKLAEAVAKDERIKEYLPYIALDTMGNIPNRIDETSANIEVDTDNANGIDKSELTEAAQDQKHFDPIQRKGLTFAAENFDKFRSFNQNDGVSLSWLGGDSNKWNISYKDLSQADEKLSDYQRTPQLIQAYETIRQVAADNDGKISTGKSTPQQLWTPVIPVGEGVTVLQDSKYLPPVKDIAIDAPTAKVLEIRINDIKKQQAEIAKLWGWEQK